MAVILFLFGLFCVWKGARFACCLLPALFFLHADPEPRRYAGDLFDPFVSLGLGAVRTGQAVLLAMVTLLLSRWLLGPSRPVSLRSPSRLCGLLFMGCAFLWWGLENHVADTREVFLEKIAPDFLAGTSNDEEAVRTAFSRNAFLCNRSYAQGINALLDGGDAQRATLFLNIIAEHCNDIEIVWSDFADSRQKDGSIVGLDGLLAADLLNIAPLFDRVTGYLERHGNEDQLLRIFRYYHARALGEDGPSRDQARAALEKFFDIAGRNRELLERIRAVAGSDPSRYFSTSGVERVSFNLLQSAAASLDADLLRACLALGFDRENTRAGSVLFYFVYFHAGQAVIDKLLAAGVDVNALNRAGQTALACALQMYGHERGRAATMQGKQEDQHNIAEIMDILFTLCDPARYRTTGGDTLLHKACRSGSGKSLELIRLLLDAGANPDLAGEGAMPPLETAAQKGWDELVPLLAAGRKRQNLPEPESAGEAGRPEKPEGARRNPSPSTGRKENERPVKPGDVRRK